MFNVLLGLLALGLLGMFILSSIKDYKANKGVYDARERLNRIKTENKVLDIQEQVERAEAKLKVRKDSK